MSGADDEPSVAYLDRPSATGLLKSRVGTQQRLTVTRWLGGDQQEEIIIVADGTIDRLDLGQETIFTVGTTLLDLDRLGCLRLIGDALVGEVVSGVILSVAPCPEERS